MYQMSVKGRTHSSNDPDAMSAARSQFIPVDSLQVI